MRKAKTVFRWMIRVCLPATLILSGTLYASDYDADTGLIDVTCLQGVVNGQKLNKVRSVQLLYEGDTLRVLSLSKTTNTGPCEATLDLISLVYEDVISIDGEDTEITAALGSGLSLDVTDLITRKDLIAEDVTIEVLDRIEVPLPSEIDLEDLDILLEDGQLQPQFIGILDSNLIIEPEEGDEGVWSLRLEWGDQVELLEVTVTENMDSSGFDISMQPDTMPEYASMNLFASTSPFNTPIGDDPAIDPDSDTLIDSIVDSMQLVVQVNQYSTPVYFADNTTPTTDVDLACGEPWELGVTQMADIPVPGWSEPSADTDGDVTPVGCGEEADQDNFMVILDLDKRCEYDFWQMRNDGDNWVASFGVGMNMDGSGVNDHGLSSRGSGFAFLGGVIWPDEMANEHIAHPLAFSYAFTKSGGPVSPATDSDGITDSGSAIPEGAVIQLDPDFDLDSLDLEPYELTIARALQEYGMILVDTGSDDGPVGFYAIDPDSVTGDMWGAVWGGEDYIALENLDVSTLPFRVLELGPQNAAFQDELDLNMGSCSAYQ